MNPGSIRVVIVGMSCSPVRSPSDKQFVNDLVDALPRRIEVAVWTLADIPPGRHLLTGRSARAHLYSENRLGHGPLSSATEYVRHPPHSPLRSLAEYSSSILRSACTGLRKLIRRFDPHVVHFCDNIGPVAIVPKLLNLRIPFVCTKRTVAFHTSVKRLAYRAFVRAGLSPAARVVTHTSAARDALSDLGIDTRIVSVVPWGVPSPAPCPHEVVEAIRARYGSFGDKLLVVGILRGSAYEMVSMVQCAMAAARSFALEFVFAIKPTKFHATVASLAGAGIPPDGMKGVTFENGPADYHELLWSADLMFGDAGDKQRTSLLPLTWLEAMARGTPVIAGSTPGASDCIRHGETGLLYGHNLSPMVCFEMMVQSDFRRELSKNAADCIAEKFSMGGIAARYVDLWSSLL